MKNLSLLVGGFNPFENMLVKLDHSPRARGETEKNETTTFFITTFFVFVVDIWFELFF